MDNFRVLTFNIWGLKYLSEKRTERLSALTTLLLTSPNHSYDVICLQEVWVEADFTLLKSALRQKYPHSAYWPNSVVGSGLAVLSKWEIVARDFVGFSVCGEPGHIGGDWYAGKGVGSIVLNIERVGEVEIFNTHFFHKGGEEGPEYLRSVRITNAWEMAKLVRKAIASGRHVIAAGDFNSSPHSLPMKIMFQHANLTDTWAVTHPIPTTDPSRPHQSSYVQTPTRQDAQTAMDAFGLTVDTPLNTWSAGKNLDNFARRWLGKRLDYILYHTPSLSQSHRSNSGFSHQLSIQNTAIVLTERIPGHEFSYSDHFGFEATFSIVPSGPSTEPGSISGGLSSEDVLTAIGALSHSLHSSNSRTRRHMIYFAACTFLLLLTLLGSSWINADSNGWKWNAFLSAFVAALASWGGTMAVCVGIIYGIRERGRLNNLIDEMECIHRR